MTDSAVKYEKDDDGIVVLTLDDPNSSANTMNQLYLESMGNAIDRLYAERDDEQDGVTGVVITSAKKTFFAGGDLKGMLAAGPDDAQQVFEMAESIKAGLRRLEKLGRPVVAAINGAALGGGLEIALACHHRIVVDDPKVDLGLPEATLGPAARRWRRHPHGADARHPGRADGRAAPGPALQAGCCQGEGPRRHARQEPRRPGAHGEEVGQGPQGRPDRRLEPVGPRRAQDPGRYAVQPQPGGVPARLPGDAAQADQGCALPGHPRDHGRGHRGCAGRLRHRQQDRVALPRRADHRLEQQEHDPGVLLRPVRHHRWLAAARRRTPVPADQGRRPRRRDDGRRHRVLLRPRGHGGRAQGRRPGVGRQGQGLQREDPGQGRPARQDGREEEGRDPRPDHRDHRGERLQGLRPGDRGGLRGPDPQGAGVRRDPGRREPRRAALLEHLDAADHRARRGCEPSGRLHRAALLLAGGQDAAGRDHPRREDHRCRGGARRSTW